MKKIVHFFIAALITVVLVFFLMRQISLKDIYAVLSQIPLYVILIAFAAYAFSFFLRSLKYKILLPDLKFMDVFDIFCIYNMMVGIMPARTGELSLLYLGRKKGIRPAKSASVLILSRAFDIISVLILFVVSSLFIKKMPVKMMSAFYLVTSFLIIVVTGLFFVMYFGQVSLKLIRKITAKLKIEHFKSVSFFMEKLDFLIKSFEVAKLHNKFFAILAVSIFTFFVQIAMAYYIVANMGINISFSLGFFTLVSFFILSALPIQAIIGIGTFESFWALVFVSAGVDKKIAISSGFAQHILSIVFLLAMGLYGLASYNIKKRQAKSTKNADAFF